MSDRQAFVQQLTTELRFHLPAAIRIVPALEYDLQGLVDTKGRFYHMDMDRVFTKTGNENKVEIYPDSPQKSLKLTLGVRKILRILHDTAATWEE